MASVASLQAGGGDQVVKRRHLHTAQGHRENNRHEQRTSGDQPATADPVGQVSAEGGTDYVAQRAAGSDDAHLHRVAALFGQMPGHGEGEQRAGYVGKPGDDIESVVGGETHAVASVVNGRVVRAETYELTPSTGIG